MPYRRLQIDLARQFFFQRPNEDGTKCFPLYRERDEVEKKFDDLKNELEAMPLRVQKIETLQGLLFIFLRVVDHESDIA